MKTIQIRELRDEVWVLRATGFSRGLIKTVHLINGNPDNITYRVWCRGDEQLYAGDDKKPNEVFDTLEELIEYYKNKKS